jgi:hypothetical protein
MPKNLYISTASTQISNIHNINSLNNNEYNSPIIYHPSVKRFTDASNITLSQFGILESNQPINFFIRDKSSQNGSVSSKDVSINGTYTVGSFKDIKINTNTLYNNFPTLAQTDPICQIIPFLHIIQSQLNFSMDYQHLMNCLSDNYNINGLFFVNIMETLIEGAYLKLFDLLFSGKCFSIKEDPCRLNIDGSQAISLEYEKKDCDNPCFTKIKIKTIQESNIYTEQDLRDRINTLGPKPIRCYGLTTMKLDVLNYNNDLSWNDVKNMSFAQLNDLLIVKWTNLIGSGHGVTIIGCENGQFQIKNSWGDSTNETISISFDDIVEHFILNFSGLDRVATNFLGIYLNYYPVVELCDQRGRLDPIPELRPCREQICKEKGYDKVKSGDGIFDECYCECSEVTTPMDAPSYCLNKGQKVQRVSDGESIGCDCPDHPNFDFYKYYDKKDKDGQTYCCERAFEGKWCEKKYCVTTDTYYTTGIKKFGYANEYLDLETQGLATNWAIIYAGGHDCSNEWSLQCGDNLSSSSSSVMLSSSSSSSNIPPVYAYGFGSQEANGTFLHNGMFYNDNPVYVYENATLFKALPIDTWAITLSGGTGGIIAYFSLNPYSVADNNWLWSGDDGIEPPGYTQIL